MEVKSKLEDDLKNTLTWQRLDMRGRNRNAGRACTYLHEARSTQRLAGQESGDTRAQAHV